MKNRKIETYLLKNRIPGIVIALLMVVCMAVIASHFNLQNRISSKTYRTVEEIEDRPDVEVRDVTLTIDRADYLGYDYYIDSERQGRYYYCQQSGKFAILLLRSTDDVVLNYTIRGRVISDDATYSKIVSGMAEDMGIQGSELESRFYPMIISEVNFPRIYYNMMLLVFVLVVLWALYNIVICIYSVCRPWKTSGLQMVIGHTADKDTVRDIDDQLRYNLYYDQDGIAITDKYFVYHSLWHTDVVGLDTIESFKKLKTSSNIGSGNKRIYKLLMVDVDGTTYEQNFKTEEALDEALTYLVDNKK